MINYLKKTPWFLPIIGGLITFISLFTPATTWNPSGNFAIQWMFQLGLRLEPFTDLGLWRTNLALLSLSIIFSVLIFASSIATILFAIVCKRNKSAHGKIKWIWVICAIIITLSTVTWIIMMELFYNAQGGSHWGDYDPNFGVIGPFIGSGLILFGVYFLKFLKEPR